ncbi:hypothetical protein HT746_05810 [Burkholderia pyrrocinia]|uniref:hypothetical protein n=1 Tax=Burkholderia pyrrocinia TaxID=60550 RepID=UPI001575D980|nr:hypothetical protein [Burkholderia pyrrocinia]NTX26659.1 hypothetical protein [Burkholderia pyrrocinia]QVN23395.1 hypothetical protein JYG32_33470 [Burkholderia pyrrocinia]
MNIMPGKRVRPHWWGGQMPARAGSFWLDSRQRAWLQQLREIWDDDVVIQIYGGAVRLRGGDVDRWFASKAELRLETLRRQRKSHSATY